ncbi:MAG: lactonase family protein [Prolixibacteraceae bacterium]|jgi:6-phosphogluconolactonase|nr:lactonase family protein [Prolixibacteraceae bacterium]
MFKYILLISIFFWSCDKSAGNEGPNNNEKEETQDSITAEVKDSSSTDIDTPVDVSIEDIEHYLYIGTYTDAGSKGIYLANFDVDSGLISTPIESAILNNASYQCISEDKKQLFSVSELGGKGQVISYSIDEEDGSLTKQSETSTEGFGPCYVSHHSQSNSILVANYNSGNVTRIKYDETSASHQHQGTGPNSSRQEGPHAHCFIIDNNGKFAYSCDLGTDKVYAYNLQEDGLKLHAEITITAGAGPRHLAFHPEMKAMSVVNELNSTVEVFLPDSNGCFSISSSAITTIPENHTTNNQCADIHYSSNGKYLYASNRGHNSIVTYQVNPVNMELSLLGWIQEKINWPRNFTLSPEGTFMLVANQNGNNITVYSIDESTGLLSFTGEEVTLSKPVCLNLLEKK